MVNFRNFSRPALCAVFCFSVIANGAFVAQVRAFAGNPAQASDGANAADDEVNRGVEAFRNARYDEATAHFRRAVELDPGNAKAKTYLGTALAVNVIPGMQTPENLKTAQEAIGMFQQVLEEDPHNVTSMRQIAGIYFNIGQLDDAKEWQKKVLDEDPQDAEAAYTIGMIDWTDAHRNALAALQKAGMNDDGMGNSGAPAATMKTIAAQNGPLVAEGLQYLSLAVQIRPNYDDAMQYLNLVYRRKADVDWMDERAREDDLASANEWVQKAMQARRARYTGNVNEPDGGNGAGLWGLLMTPAPPPPPPPPPTPPRYSGSAPGGLAPPRRVNISAGVAAGMLIQKTQPIYPPIARAARVSGTVVLRAIISNTGEVESLRVVSGPAMLQQAAMDAVKNWRYRPYLLNNEPVEVETTVNVIFALPE